jgi:hypothetical protein
MNDVYSVAPHQFEFLANFRNCFDVQQKVIAPSGRRCALS